MTINTRRMFALLLAVFLALSLFPGAAFAAEEGTSTEPGITEPEESATDPPLDERSIDEIWAELEAALPEAYYDESNLDDPYPRGIPQDNFFPEEFYMDPASFPSLFTTESDFPAEMWDNDVLDSLQYIGYDVAYLKSINRLYDYNYMASRLLTNAPGVLSDVGYSGAVWVNGDGTVEDSTTVTGYAPNVARFEKYGLCCASFVAYYYCNYLPNIAGVDTTVIYDAVKEWGKDTVNNRYDLTSVSTWLYALNDLAKTEGSGVTRYTDEDTAYENLRAGDIIIFKSIEGTGFAHVAIYLGEAPMHNGSTTYGTYHYIAHVGNSRGPEISVAEYMSSGGSKASTPYYWYHIELEDQEQLGAIEVYKKDPNGAALAGAQFLITNTVTGEYFNLGPTDENGYATTGEATIPYGTYTVKETVFPEGYQASGTGEWTVTVDDTTPTVTINAVNELILGHAKIVKETTNDGTKAGWHFEVKDAAGTVIGTYVTDDTGEIVLDLVPGIYTVTETDGAYKYWVNDPNPTRTVTVVANETATVTFINQWRGQAQIIKTATNGGSVAGWHFEVKDSNGTVVGNYTTDSIGVITLDLEPGTYTVTETDGAYTYWENDPNPSKTVAVKAGETAKVTFTNKWRGQAQIIKTATNGGSVAGWHFEVKDSNGTVVGNYVTDATGIITLDLEPGTYTVTETDGAYQYWENDPNPSKTVTVNAGETVKVTFANQWRGQAQIVKTATNGGSVAGWHFEVKDSNGTVVGNYVTDATGIITIDLEPGTYTVTETDGEYKYWVNDPTPTKTVTVKAGETAEVTFQNQWRGQAQIVKTATNGGSVAGWHFEVKDSSGTVVGNYVTDATGIITLDLEPGTYTVTETDGVYEYWHNDPNPVKTVTVKAGETAKVTFENQWVGKASIFKTTTNGGTVEGWEFTITDADGNTVGTYTTDASGTILVDLNPGTYTVTETDLGDPYWYCDTVPQTITVKAGETATVTFNNQWIGKAKIIKTLANPEAGSLKDWLFKITDANGKDWGTYGTDDTGIILLDLEPGVYTVMEVLEDDSLWQCTSQNPQTITVTAGQTAEVTFSNALRPGEINIQKVNTKGEPLEGVEFLLEWSTDGINWSPVTYTDSAVPQIGGCTTEGLTDGKLLSNTDGVVTFSGIYPTLQYRLTETATKEGYQLLADYAYVGGLSSEDDLTVSITVVNAEVFKLPETGSLSLALIQLSSMMCQCICAGAMVYLRKKKQA